MNHREELELLVELAHVGNMRRAADALGISQSTLSDFITRLETLYGAVLFERDRRGSRPTVYGKVVVSSAVQALRAMDEAHREIGLIKDSAGGRLAVGYEPGLGEPFLTEAIARGLRRYPSLRYRLQASSSSALVQEVRDKHIDFFLGLRPDVPTDGLELIDLGTVNGVPFVRRDHVLAGAISSTLREIMRFPVVQGPGPRWFIRRIANELQLGDGTTDFRGNAAVVVNDFSVVRAIVRNTDAVGFAIAAMLQGDTERNEFAPIRLPDSQQALLNVPLLIGTLENRSLPPSARVLINEVREVVRAFAADAASGA